MSLRQLAWMAQSHREDEWGRLSSLMALVASLVSGKKQSPSQFNPYSAARAVPTPKIPISQLRAFFFPGQAIKPALIGGGSIPVNPGNFIRG